MKWAAVVAAALGLFAGCADPTQGKEIAEPEVAKFRALMQAREFARLYDSTGDEFKAATSREQGIALFSAVHRKLGPLESARQVNSAVNTRDVTTVVLIYASDYRDGDATETFTYQVEGGKAQLVGYNIQSLEMLIR